MFVMPKINGCHCRLLDAHPGQDLNVTPLSIVLIHFLTAGVTWCYMCYQNVPNQHINHILYNYDYFRQLREFCRQATRDEAGLGGSEFFHLYVCLDELGCWMSIVN